jgi:flagellar export protein FliJ
VKPFTMHTVLRYRRQLEDLAQQTLHQALEAEARLQEMVQQTDKELTGLYADLQRDWEQGTTVDRLSLFESRINLVRQDLKSQQDALAEQQDQVTQKRKILVKKSKDRKIIEKLQEQQNAAYADFLKGKERAMLDEIATLSHERRQR